MTDLALLWSNELGLADLDLDAGALTTDDGLRTAILISLFTDARARDDDPLPAPEDRRGWWGDALGLDENDEIGSRLWLLLREKLTQQTVNRAREYATEALAWLTGDGVARSVTVIAEAQRPDRLNIGVEIDRPTGPGRQRFDFVWDATTGAGHAV